MELKPAGVLAYHDLFLAMTLLDAGWSRTLSAKGGLDPLDAATSRYVQACWSYISSVREERLRQLEGAGMSPASEAVDNRVCNPLCFQPSGKGDLLGLALLDDFDVLQHLRNELLGLEEILIGFAVRMERLLGPLPANDLFVEVTDLWGAADCTKPVCDDAGVWRAGPHTIHRTAPVMTFTRLKVDGVLTLWRGEKALAAVFRTLAATFRKAVRRLKEVSQQWSELYSCPDVDSARITFLALQGQEEVGVLIFSSNISVNVALLREVWPLTIGSALDEPTNGELCEELVRDLDSGSARQLPPSDPSHLLRELGVRGKDDAEFRSAAMVKWSKTLVGWPFQASDGDDSLHGGWVELSVQCQTAPGFDCEIQDAVAYQIGKVFPAGSLASLPPQARFHQLGTADCTLVLSHEPSQVHPSSVVRLAQGMRFVRSLMHSAARHNASGKGELHGLSGVSAVLAVPTPEHATKAVAQLSRAGASITRERLLRVRESIFGPALRPHQPLNLAALRQMPKTFMGDRALQRTIETIYKQFNDAVTNPNAFDLVVDLYDAFATFHQLLCRWLVPAQLSSFPVYCNELHIEQLSEFAEALERALSDRLTLAHPAEISRDMNLNFTGANFVQLLYGADAPLKVAVGLLRHALAPEKKLHEVALLVRVSNRPGVRVKRLRFGKRFAALNAPLGFLEADVSHLLHPGGSFTDYLHEAFHVLFDWLLVKHRPERKAAEMTPEQMKAADALAMYFPRESALNQYRLEETFVHALTLELLFKGDVEAFTFYYTRRFAGVSGALDKASSGGVMRYFTRFAEEWMRMYTAAVVIAPEYKSSEKMSELLQSCIHSLPLWSRLTSEGQESVLRAVSIHRDVFWRESSFELYQHSLLRYLKSIRKGLASCMNHHCMTEPRPEKLAHSLRQGMAYLSEESSAADLLIVCGVLLTYLNPSGFQKFRQEGARCYLARRLKKDFTGSSEDEYEIDWTGKTTDSLLDLRSPQSFSASGKRRRERLSAQIGVCRTFWDVSTRMRMRRFVELLKLADWQEDQSTFSPSIRQE